MLLIYHATRRSRRRAQKPSAAAPRQHACANHSPSSLDAAYTLALGVQLSALLHVLDPTVRPKAVEAINRLLEKNRSGYKLVSIS